MKPFRILLALLIIVICASIIQIILVDIFTRKVAPNPTPAMNQYNWFEADKWVFTVKTDGTIDYDEESIKNWSAKDFITRYNKPIEVGVK